MSVNTNIIPLTTNNTISEMMLKVNELVFNFDEFFTPSGNTALANTQINGVLTVRDDIIVENNSVLNHIANNYAHGVVIENLTYDENSGVLTLFYNDSSNSSINIDIGIDDDAVFKTVTANTFYGYLQGNANTSSNWITPITLTLTGNVSGNVSFDGSSNVSLSVDIPNWNANSTIVVISSNTTIENDFIVQGNTTFNNISNFYNDVSITGNTFIQNDLTITGNVNSSYFTGNANTSSNWLNPINLNLLGDVSGNVSFDGSSNVSLNVDIPNFSSNSTFVVIPNTFQVLGLTDLKDSLHVGGSTTFYGDVLLTNGSLTCNTNTFNLIPNPSILYIGSGTANTLLGSLTGTVTTRNNLDVVGTLNVLGQNISSNTSIFNLLNTTANTINFGGEAHLINIGATSGITAIRNNSTIAGNLSVSGNTSITGTLFLNGGLIDSSTSSVSLFTSATYVTIGNSANNITIGSNSGITQISNNLNVSGLTTFSSNVEILGTSLNSPSSSFYIVPTSNNITIGSLTSTTSVNNLSIHGTLTAYENVSIAGDLTVSGNTTIINTTTLQVEDKNIEIGLVSSPSDLTADGGGITLKGLTDKTIIWNNSNSNWNSSENWNLSVGKTYKINNVDVISSTSLGSSVVNSSLTSVGIITSGTWSGSFGTVSGSNLTNLTAGNLTGTIPSTVLGNSSLNIGTTSISLNRASSSQTLTGVSIDGNSNTATYVVGSNVLGTTLASNIVNSSLTSVGTITSGTWNGTTIAQNKGGTGIISYSPGDILYADASGNLQKLPAGSIDQILQINSSGIPTWITNIDGGYY